MQETSTGLAMRRSTFLPRVFLALLLGLGAAVSRAGAAAPAPQEELGEIRGQVLGRQGAGLTPLPNALLEISRGSRAVTLTADAQGSYRATGLLPGRWRVRALHVGYEGMEVEVHLPPGGTVALDLELRWEPIALPPITVRGDPLRAPGSTREAPAEEVGEVALRALEGSTGMVEGGLVQMARSLPGNDPSDPRDILLMRGSATDLKLVLLDGAPLYTPFHMAGLVESFDPGALGGASLFLGGAPARFDGGLSYILDLRARSPRRERVTGSASADLLTARGLVEGPLTGSTAFLVGGRSIHDLGTPVLGRGASPYGYGDLLGRLEWEGEGGHRAYLTGFWNRETVLLDLPGADELPTTLEPGGENRELLSLAEEDRARWGNRALAAGLRGDWGRTAGEIRAAASVYEALLPMGDSLPLFAEGRSDRARFTADFSRPWGEGALHFGGSLDDMSSFYRALALDTAQGAPPGQTVPTRLRQQGTTGGVYLEAQHPLGPALRLRGGLRMDRFSGDGGIRMAPRVALTWLLTDQAMLTVAAGRYHQFSTLQADEIEESLDPSNFAGGGVRPPPRVGAANHLVVTLDQLLTPGVRLGLEGFVKSFDGVSASREEGLRASGVDLRVAREGRRASGWLGYTLTWFWASNGILSSGDSPFSGRHLLSAGMAASLTDRTGVRVKASYGDGLPYTSVPLRSDASPVFAGSAELAMEGDVILNSAPGLATGPDEGFLRMEVELHGSFFPTVGGHRTELRPYLRVLNALNRRDALFYHFAPWQSGGPEPLADLPVLPLLGVEWRF